MPALLAMVAIIALAVFGMSFIILFRAWVISLVWNWYIASGFGVDEISVVTSLGISVLVALVTYRTDLFKDDFPGKKSSTDIIWESLSANLWFLFIAWVGTFFI